MLLRFAMTIPVKVQSAPYQTPRARFETLKPNLYSCRRGFLTLLIHAPPNVRLDIDVAGAPAGLCKPMAEGLL